MSEDWKSRAVVENPNNETLRQAQGRISHRYGISTLRAGGLTSRVAREISSLKISLYFLASPRASTSSRLLLKDDPQGNWPLLARYLHRLHPSLVSPRTDVSWYKAELPILDNRTRKFYEKQLDLSGQELDNPLINIRSEAWKLVQYPCIGQWWFLSSTFAKSPHYQEVIESARQGASIVDVACGFGQELRFLREDGATGDMYAVDLLPQLWNLSLRLYNETIPPATFIKGQFFRGGGNELLSPLAEKVDIFMVNDFLHLFEPWCSTGHFIRLIASHCKVNSRVVGWTFGTPDPDPAEYQSYGDQTLDSTKFEYMCKAELAAIKGHRWTVDCRLSDPEDMGVKGVASGWALCPAPVKVVCFLLTRVE